MTTAATRCAGVLLLVSLAGPACRSVRSGKPEAPVPLGDPHHHVVDVSRSWAMENPNEGFSLVEVPALPSGTELDERALSPDGRFQAFATCEPGCRVLVQPVGRESLLELRGPAFSELRPFSGLVWLTADILVFDQWTQPHYGIHYAVDVRNRRLLQAAPFPDRIEEH
ncbi:hypothetical protein CYFUS_008126 [Cystobacter fuscus]|uniref:Lipoprotein n=1 Tax=Cystobacter fuscus TaxID=43 RepID=A0A250JGN3_9BACT|nr:hypothetical protein [Cystobacter fuscus]ATB42647.1 hypothetical protein CYFUS_008126 [Cystobacter fuscus]